MNKKYQIDLNEAEKARLCEVLSSSNVSRMAKLHAQVLIASDSKSHPSLPVREICEQYKTNHTTVYSIRATYVEKGLNAALTRKARTVSKETRKLNTNVYQKIEQLAGQTPPNGRKRWSIRSLCKASEEQGIVKSISTGSMQTVLKELHIDLQNKE